MEWFKSNTTLKLVSLLLAIIVWIFVKALITETSVPQRAPTSILRLLGLVSETHPAASGPKRTNAVPRNAP
jgi:hypothetical protein